MHVEQYFATEWPAELPRLRRMLSRNGVARDAVDDVIQETAIRLYSAWGRVFEDRPLRPLLNTMALNAARDFHRRTHYEVRPVAEVPEVVARNVPDAEHVALARLEVARAGRAMSKLTDRQRSVLLSAVSDELAGEERGRARAPAAQRMAITRARRRLAEVLEITAAATGVALASLAGAGRRKAGRTAAATGGLLLVAATVVGLYDRDGGDHGVQVTRVSDGAAGTRGPSTESGMSQWRYDTSSDLAEALRKWDATGTSQWNWDENSWLNLNALGTEVSVGSEAPRYRCQLDVGGVLSLDYDCLPISPEDSPPAAKAR